MHAVSAYLLLSLSLCVFTLTLAEGIFTLVRSVQHILGEISY